MSSSFPRSVLITACTATLLVAAAFPANLLAADTDGTAADTARTGQHAALSEIPVATLDGKLTRLAVRDGPVMLQFWASWCHSCGGVMWELDGLSAAHPRVPYFAVSIDEALAEAARIKTHPLYARHPDRYLHDHEGALARRLAIEVVPAIVLLDCSGHERLRHVGHVNSSDLLRLRQALAELSTTPSQSETAP